jgi:hypothetical protein
MSESKITRNDSSFLITLIEHISAQVVLRGFCLVFDDDLERCFPSNQMSPEERNTEIYRFAECQGWTATTRDGVFGTTTIFQRLEPDDC